MKSNGMENDTRSKVPSTEYGEYLTVEIVHDASRPCNRLCYLWLGCLIFLSRDSYRHWKSDRKMKGHK